MANAMATVTGRQRPMTIIDGFIYNFLAMGVIFPWLYLWGPAAFPGANISVAILIAAVAQVPIAVAYAFLACVFPGNGGDYVYQTRTLGTAGAVCVLSGFVVWILQWIALSGWLFSTLGLAPLVMCVGVNSRNSSITSAGVVLQSPGGVLVVTLILAVTTVYFLQRGMKLFVSIQRWLFVLTLSGVAAMVIVFIGPAEVLFGNINYFARTVITEVGVQVPDGMLQSFVPFVVNDAAHNGIAVTPKFSWLATLGMVPITWASLQWSVYSVEQNAEIQRSRSLSNQLVMLVAPVAAVALLLILVAQLEQKALSAPFLTSDASLWWSKNGSPVTVSFLTNVLQPFPNVLAIASSGSITVGIIIAVGFLANAFQVSCNCFIGMSRVMVRMSRDGVLPRWLASDHPAGSLATPRRANWIYLLASIPVMVAFFLVDTWRSYTLGSTVACGYVFVGSTIAIFRLPWTRSWKLVRRSELRNFPRWSFIVLGILSSALSGAMVLSYLLVPNYRLVSISSLIAIFAVAAFAAAIVTTARLRGRKPILKADLRTSEVTSMTEEPAVKAQL